jgi:Peptidase family M48
MADLSKARSNANRIRFSADYPARSNERYDINTIYHRDNFYQDAIELSQLVTPTLWDHFCIACERLQLPRECVSPFIYSSRDVQAECYADPARGCIIRFSSGLIDLLDEQEFEFVIGHELGHFLLDHHLANVGVDPAGQEYFRQRRSQEISVDRIGLVACASLDVALRALMKTISGLTERHLRFDVGAFVSQLRKIESTKVDLSNWTHPSIVIRAKALLWFSLSEYFQKGPNDHLSDGLKKIDERIERDVNKFMDRAAHERVASARLNLLLWIATADIVRSGSFRANAQAKMRETFGPDTIDKLTSFLRDLSKSEAESTVNEKLTSARVELKQLAPRQFDAECSALEKEARELLSATS